MLHQPAAHSDGDSIVFFRRSDVIATGDLFDSRAIRSSTPRAEGRPGACSTR